MDYGCIVALIMIPIGLVLGIIQVVSENRKLARMSPAERAEHDAEHNFGPINSNLFCPHCQTKGHVRTKPIKQKKGVSGGKATAAILTGGVTLLATGLSRKEANTQAHCMNCESTWVF